MVHSTRDSADVDSLFIREPMTPQSTTAARVAKAANPGHARGTRKSTLAAIKANARVGRSGVNVPARPSMALRMTATAAKANPCSSDTSSATMEVMPTASPVISMAEGRMKQLHATRPPIHPRCSTPMAKQVCDDEGPGNDWHSAMRSAKVASSIHASSSTKRSRKCARWATGPPNAMHPKARKRRARPPRLGACSMQRRSRPRFFVCRRGLP